MDIDGIVRKEWKTYKNLLNKNFSHLIDTFINIMYT